MSLGVKISGISLKIFKLILVIIILIIYRTGYGNGEFLGVGGVWNHNEAKGADAEIVASGTFIGFTVYTLIVLFAQCFDQSKGKSYRIEIVMNILGFFMWGAVGCIALIYWGGYMNEHKYTQVLNEKQVGIALGTLCIIESALYGCDTLIAYRELINSH
ncbi:protein snakeskin-like [Trichogramma pretiosum]|uniref:protein snakeskin-like n=1 Tax=Trichogramma pretiosum TaxID=7493 RepID=UPI0006C9748E|nr:protein snakeskin-like [Trichogramma pretiosum]